MEQSQSSYEGYLEALRDDIQGLGGAKVIGKLFMPDLDVEPARNWLNDRLNANRRERLSDTQERLIMRMAREKRGFSAALYFVCDDVGFERPKPRNPYDEAAEAQRRFIEAIETAKRFADKLERLADSNSLKVVK